MRGCLLEGGGVSSSIDRGEILRLVQSYMRDSREYFFEMNAGYDDETRSMPTFGSGVVAKLLRIYNKDGNRYRYSTVIRDKRGVGNECRFDFVAYECKSGGKPNYEGFFDFKNNVLYVYMPFKLNEWRVPEWVKSSQEVVDVIVHELTHYVTSTNKGIGGVLKPSDCNTSYYIEKNDEFRQSQNETLRIMGCAVMKVLYFLHFNERNSFATSSAEYAGQYTSAIEESINILRNVLPSRMTQGQLHYFYGCVVDVFNHDNTAGMYIPATYSKLLSFAESNYRKLRLKLRKNNERRRMG